MSAEDRLESASEADDHSELDPGAEPREGDTGDVDAPGEEAAGDEAAPDAAPVDAAPVDAAADDEAGDDDEVGDDDAGARGDSSAGASVSDVDDRAANAAVGSHSGELDGADAAGAEEVGAQQEEPRLDEPQQEEPQQEEPGLDEGRQDGTEHEDAQGGTGGTAVATEPGTVAGSEPGGGAQEHLDGTAAAGFPAVGPAGQPPDAYPAGEAGYPQSDPDGGFENDLTDAEAGSWVRPYVWTGGRTGSTVEFALETLVSARSGVADTDPDAIREEHRRVLELCEHPRSVTEIAARLSVPLGVAKTLIGAMAEEGMLVVHRAGAGAESGPDLELMERVLRGLRNL